MKAKSMLTNSLWYLLLLPLIATSVATAQAVNTDANSTDNSNAITATANLLKNSYTLGQPVPIEIAVTNHGQEPVYIDVDEFGYLGLGVTVEDVNGTKIEHGPVSSPPPPPRYFWITVDGKKIFTLPVVEIEPGQTIKLTIQDALNLYHDYLQEGVYYLTPRELTVIHEVNSITIREDQEHKLWIEPSTVISRARYEINKVEISLRQGKIIYVDDNAVGLNDGSSWQNAYTFLQDALADAEIAVKPVEIRVAQGIYTPDENSISPDGIGNRGATFQLINDVTIEGGYAGFGEPDPNARDIEAYETILSGDLLGDDIDIDDPCDLRGAPNLYDNSKVVVTGSNTDATAVLDGFTISSGHWDEGIGDMIRPRPVRIVNGGAGMNNSAGSPTVIRCIFTLNITNWHGAGMHNAEGSNPTVIDCTFTINYAEGGGAAMANRTDCNPEATNCNFSDNFIQYDGGAMYNLNNSPTLTNCTFSRNSAFRPLYGYDVKGGGMYNINSNPVLTNCTFSENSAAIGGAMYNEDCNTVMNMCEFVWNTASSYCGAVLNNGGQLVAKGCVFKKNYPGAVYDGNSNGLTFTNCIFSGNSSQYNGGAVRVEMATFSHCIFAGNVAIGYYSNDGIWHRSSGGAVYSFSTLAFNNCTFSNNWAELGCALYCYRTYANNCIFWGTKDQIYPDRLEGEYVFADYSNIHGGWPGEGNIDADPCFVDPGYWADADDPNVAVEPNDPNAVWVDGDYHLKSQAGRWDPVSESWVQDDVTSPCIDAGDPNSPIGHEPFPNGGIINIGAYGGTQEASKSISTIRGRF